MVEIPDARITPTNVYIGGAQLPGLIEAAEEGGVQVLPGGNSGVNRVCVTFLVGRVEVEDSTSP